jgi:mevalonate pyrophosphate decarboxylase
VGRAHARLAQVKEALKRGDLPALSETVLIEALDMHELFHTSDPVFSYMNESSHLWVKRFQAHDKHFPSVNAVVTLDAGANVHVFVPEVEERSWERYFQSQTDLRFVKSRSGKGARYIDSSGF